MPLSSLFADTGLSPGIGAPSPNAIVLFLNASVLSFGIGAPFSGIFLFACTSSPASFFLLSTLSTSFYIPLLTFVLHMLFFDASYLFFSITSIAMLLMQTKLEVKKWLKAIFLNYLTLAKLQSITPVINRKRLFDTAFIISSLTNNHKNENLI